MEGHNSIVGLIFCLSNEEVLMNLRKWSGFLKFHLEERIK